nr:MAG: hypothetical protein DIU78_22135 [Pseudomonadota bacterium]
MTGRRLRLSQELSLASGLVSKKGAALPFHVFRRLPRKGVARRCPSHLLARPQPFGSEPPR